MFVKSDAAGERSPVGNALLLFVYEEWKENQNYCCYLIPRASSAIWTVLVAAPLRT